MWLQLKILRLKFSTVLFTHESSYQIHLHVSPKSTCCSSPSLSCLSNGKPHWHLYLDHIRCDILWFFPTPSKIIFSIISLLAGHLAVLSSACSIILLCVLHSTAHIPTPCETISLSGFKDALSLIITES